MCKNKINLITRFFEYNSHHFFLLSLSLFAQFLHNKSQNNGEVERLEKQNDFEFCFCFVGCHVRSQNSKLMMAIKIDSVTDLKQFYCMGFFLYLSLFTFRLFSHSFSLSFFIQFSSSRNISNSIVFFSSFQNERKKSIIQLFIICLWLWLRVRCLWFAPVLKCAVTIHNVNSKKWHKNRLYLKYTTLKTHLTFILKQWYSMIWKWCRRQQQQQRQ